MAKHIKQLSVTDRRKRDLSYKHKQRDAERRFLMAQGWDVDKDGAFITAWRRGEIEVSWKVKEGK